ncbi:HEPN domain-containing protein [Metabacillus sp. 113a]|uniref:ApeA N-terminal domain 1-containing protein n=1 Tax=Metabacillus sp. 113a TaxID=3404706 RepID=UPI003CF5BC27
MGKVKIKDQDLFGEFQIKGYWGLPNSDKKISGILFYKSDEIKLELNGTLDSNSKESLFKYLDIAPIILGDSDSGEKFTLLNCTNSNFSFNLTVNGFNTETYSIDSIIVGGHFNSVDEISFHSIAIYPTYFSKWTSKSPFVKEYGLKDGTIGTLNNISFPDVDLFEEYIPSMNAKVKEVFFTNVTGDYSDNFNYTYKGGLKIIPDEWKSFNEFNEVLYQFLRLYTLLVGSPTYLEKVVFYGEENAPFNKFEQRKKYYFFKKQKDMKIINNFTRHDSLINYETIKDNFSQVIGLWFEKSEALKNIKDIYFTDFYMEMYLETRFLNAVQTLEIYHRKKNYDVPMDSEEYMENCQKLLFQIQGNFPEDFSEIIISKLTYGNEYSLGKRLRTIIKELNPETKTFLIGNSDDRNRFVQQLVETRNYLTHYDLENKQNVLHETDEIYYAFQRVKAISTIVLFKEIGLDEDIILSKIMENSKYSNSISTAKKVLNKC